MIRHTGRLPGMRSIMMGDVDARVGVYYMANATECRRRLPTSGSPCCEVKHTARGTSAIKVDPKLLARYVGVYDMEGDVLTIKLRDGKLYLDKNGRKGDGVFRRDAVEFFHPGQPSDH